MALAEVHDFPEPDRFVANVARNIRSLLAMRGIPAKELAGRIGMTDTTLSQRMGGHNRWLAIELHRIAQVFDVDTDVVFADTEEEFLEALRSRCVSAFDLVDGLDAIAHATPQIPGQRVFALASDS